MIIALDIGGTKTLAAAADDKGAVLRRERVPTPAGLAEGLAMLDRLADAVAGGERAAGVGVSIGGPIDPARGTVSPLHQPAWRDVPLAAILAERHGCPVRIEVDTDAAALAERRFGGRTDARLLYLTLSTGMGGGFLVDGQVYRGTGGAHPEVGHQAIPHTIGRPVPCPCGAEGCLEALVSGNGIRRLYGKPAEALDAGEWQQVACHLGTGLRNMAAIYAPDVIVLGGSVALGGGERLIADAGDVMRSGLRLVPAPRLEMSTLQNDTALHGAIALGLAAR